MNSSCLFAELHRSDVLMCCQIAGLLNQFKFAALLYIFVEMLHNYILIMKVLTTVSDVGFCDQESDLLFLLMLFLLCVHKTIFRWH